MIDAAYGVRTEDWETVCEDRLPVGTFVRIRQAVQARAIARNIAENERDARLGLHGGSATHRY